MTRCITFAGVLELSLRSIYVSPHRMSASLNQVEAVKDVFTCAESAIPVTQYFIFFLTTIT
ncbi:hypothetical protein ACFL5V_03410 [Fibrobacterota bacterium]